jgi:hypothetical protein
METTYKINKGNMYQINILNIIYSKEIAAIAT